MKAMLRLLLTIALAMPFLALGAPLCCFVGASCCHVAPQAESAPPPCCPRCPDTDEPAPQPPPRCDCSDHPVDLALAEAASAPAAVAGAQAATPAEPLPLVREAVTVVSTTPPPAHAVLTLPLLL